MSKEAHGISLICATKYRTKELQRLLESLVAQTDQRFEIIVVDQNPDQSLVPIIQRFEGSVRLTHISSRAHSNSQARNDGVKHASFDWLGFPDDDCWYPPDFVEGFNKISSSNASARFVNWSDPQEPSADPVFSFVGGPMSLQEGFHLVSCICLFVKRDAFDRADGFDERMGLGASTIVKAGEEQDLTLRLLNAQEVVMKTPELRVYHPIGSRTWDKAFEERIVSQGACDFYFTRKYLGMGPALRILLNWMAGAAYNLLRFRRQNFFWYFYKVYGGLIVSSRLS